MFYDTELYEPTSSTRIRTDMRLPVKKTTWDTCVCKHIELSRWSLEYFRGNQL